MIYVVYGKQEDSVPAAAVAYWALRIVNEPITVVSHPMNQVLNIEYGSGDTFYFIGYGFIPSTKEFLVKLLEDGVKVIWLDNHRSSFEVHGEIMNSNYPKKTMNSEINITKSTIELIWDYFYPNEQHPLAVSLIDDWERYNMNNNVVRYFHTALVVQDQYLCPDSDLWRELLTNDEKVNEIVNIGKYIAIHQKRNEIRNLKHISIYELENGLKAAVLNSIGDRYVFDVAYKLFDACILYHFDGIEWYYQVFSRHKNLAGNYALIHGGNKNFRSWTSGFKKNNDDHAIYWDYLNSHRIGYLYDHPTYQQFIDSLDAE